MTKLRTKHPLPWKGLGVDTETYHGWARLICTDHAYTHLEEGDWKKAFDFLLSQTPTLAAWNLRFDAEAILKHLGPDALTRLYATERLNLGAYKIELVPWKMLRITHARRTVELYDISPFYGGRLDDAAHRFLNERKTKLPFHTGDLNTKRDVWETHTDLIVQYCCKDANLTNRLATVAGDSFNRLGGTFHRPYSVAFVAADILMRDTDLRRLPDTMYAPAEAAFRGARFECIQRGRFPDLHAYDIKSAYPAHAILVPDAPGRWITGAEPRPDALHAIIKCRATIPPDDFPIMAPLPYLMGGRIIYPTGTFTTTLLKAEYEKWRDHLTPLKSWSYVPNGEVTYPYRPTLERLLAMREESDPMTKDSAKRGANSVYGKLLNQRVERTLVPADSTDHFGGPILMVDGEAYRVERKRKPGMLYHPLHAGIITEACRIQIWGACEKAGFENVVGVQADGIMTRGNRLGTTKAKTVGDLGFVASGDSVVCGSGLYEIKGYARRTRGVMFHATNEGKGGKARRLKGKGWFTHLRGKRSETVDFTDVRPAHISECLRGGRYESVEGVRSLGLKDANVFLPFTRSLNVCRDHKRLWPHIGEARRLLKERFGSAPHALRHGESRPTKQRNPTNT